MMIRVFKIAVGLDLTDRETQKIANPKACLGLNRRDLLTVQSLGTSPSHPLVVSHAIGVGHQWKPPKKNLRLVKCVFHL
ncbi:MAG: hypothetical protein Ct9H90mP16_06410 [Candidatus Poseidoniales archaeon]|nr:MAG: hypothetical protein Ct9H90mP16_06410 [Candidatus Poseidoniales archaeon]